MSGEIKSAALAVPGTSRFRVDFVQAADASSVFGKLNLPRRVKTIGGGSGTSSLFSVGLSLDTKPRITHPFMENGWVHACVKAKASAIAGVPFEIWVGDPRVDKQARLLDANDPLARLFRAPNPVQTAAQFFEAGAAHAALDGEDFWFLLDAKGQPLMPDSGLMLPIPSQILSVRGTRVGLMQDPITGLPRQWSASMFGRGLLIADAWTVIQFRDYNPDDPLRGLGDVESILSDIDLEWQATRYQRAILANGGDPGGYVNVGGTALREDERKALEDQLREEFGPGDAGRWHVANGKDATFVPNDIKPKDMDFATLLKWCRDKISGATGVPPPMIGVLDNATLHNFGQAVELFWKGGNGILPYLASREDVINNRLLSRVRHPSGGKLFGRFNTNHVEALREDKGKLFDIAVKLWTSNVGYSQAEALQLAGLDVEEGLLKFADLRLVPKSVTTVDRIVEDAKNPPQPPPASATPANGNPTQPVDDGASKSAQLALPAAPIVALEVVKAADPAPAEDPAKARTERMRAKHAALLEAGVRAMKRPYKTWSQAYERAQYRRLRDFAEEGESALRIAGSVTKDQSVPPPPDDLESLLLRQLEWQKKLSAAFEAPIFEIFANALEDMAAEIEHLFPLVMEDPRVTRILSTQLIKLVEGHTSTLADQVRGALDEALKKATTTGTLQERVKEVLPEIEGSLKNSFSNRDQRAQVIALTETAKAMNAARYLEMQQAGVFESTWRTSHDIAVRGDPDGPYADAKFSHFELDGKTVPLGQEFHRGLKYPTDENGEAGDVIRCRCFAEPAPRRQQQEEPKP